MARMRDAKTSNVGAPRGNKNAVKGLSVKTSGYRLRLTPENLEILKNIAEDEKSTLAQVIEKALLRAYPKRFDGRF